MLCGKVNDQPLIRLCEGVETHDEPIRALPDRAGKRGRQIFWLSYVEKLGLHPEGLRRSLDILPRWGMEGLLMLRRAATHWARGTSSLKSWTRFA